MAANAGPHLSGQIAMMWTAGQRVSSSLYGCRVCDYVTTPGLEQITFHHTKNGEPVVAAVHPAAALLMESYLAWRGDLDDREAPLFLTHRREPYEDNDKAYGGQTKRAFQGMKRRTIQSLRDRAAVRASDLRRIGKRAEASSVIGKAKEQASLVAQVTPHWFRHRLATTMLSKTGNLRAVMEQGGWSSDIVLTYAHDVPEHRRELVNQMVGPLADIDTSLTRVAEPAEKDL
jgi:integrase